MPLNKNYNYWDNSKIMGKSLSVTNILLKMRNEPTRCLDGAGLEASLCVVAGLGSVGDGRVVGSVGGHDGSRLQHAPAASARPVLQRRSAV